jgi:hypothetical protein
MKQLLNQEIDIIPDDAIVDIKVSGFFYKRLIHVSHVLSNAIGVEKINEIAKEIDQNKIESDEAYAYETIYSFISEISDKAIKAGLTEKTKIDEDLLSKLSELQGTPPEK